MAKRERPLTVEIPSPADEQPAWSRVGVIAVVGFVLGVAWPKLAGVHIGPSVPGDIKPQPEASASALAPAPASSAATAQSEGAPAEEGDGKAQEPEGKNEQLVVVGAGKITRCYDSKDKKVDDCGELQFDPVALPKLRELARCPAALGLEGKLPIAFELNFDKKEVQVLKGKKTTLPTSTVAGIVQCAVHEFSNVALDEVPHKYRRYSLVYTATFYPPGKHPDAAPGEPPKDKDDEERAAGTTTNEAPASGTATISWDTALVRSEPKEGDIVVRLVRGTRVKLVGRQNDWYRIEHRGKSGWVYRGAIGL